MLCLAEIELILFIVAGIVLCFGFVKKKSLGNIHFLAIAEQCLHSVKDFFSSRIVLQ